MMALIAGWAAGYGMSIVTTITLTILLVRVRDTSRFERIVAREVSGALLAVPVFMGTALVWTMIGLVLGSVFHLGGFASQPAMLGAPGGSWLVIALGVGAAPLPPLVLLFHRYWWLWLTNALAFAVLFGWVMPFLATR